MSTPVNMMRHSLFNFTNPATETGYPSQACAINGLLYTESVPFQEVIGLVRLPLSSLPLVPLLGWLSVLLDAWLHCELQQCAPAQLCHCTIAARQSPLGCWTVP